MKGVNRVIKAVKSITCWRIPERYYEEFREEFEELYALHGLMRNANGTYASEEIEATWQKWSKDRFKLEMSLW